MAKYIDKSVVIAEIERRRKEWWYGSSTEAKFKKEECDDILSFLDTLEVKDVQEESLSNDLEEAANDYAHDLVHDDVFETFIAGAQWQKQQDQSTIELAEDHAYLAGQEKMIDKACEFIETYPHLFMGVLRSEVIEDFKNYIKKSKL